MRLVDTKIRDTERYPIILAQLTHHWAAASNAGSSGAAVQTEQTVADARRYRADVGRR